MDRTTRSGAVSLRGALVYGAVGIGVILAYLGLTLGLARLGVAPPVANALGVIVAVLLSYAGHHRLTFARQGRHRKYFLRFMVVSAAFLGLTTLWTWLATRHLGLSPDLAALAVVVGYPPCSYLLNAFWTFR